jgi:alginate O-acetyltransferase complex protein AlgJ
MEKTDKRMKINRLFSLTTACLLIILLCLPIFQMSLHIFPDLKSQENRILATQPELKPATLSGLWKYIQDYQNYFNDNFGFRNVFIRINSFINLKIFGVSPTPLPDIVAGKEGWLFYNNPNDGSSLNDYYGLAGFTFHRLSAIKQNMTRLRREVASRNILLILAIAPSKHTVYEEYLPTRVAMMKGNLSRVDQLRSVWGEDDTYASFIDARRLLAAAKREMKYPLYYKTDTHWNNLGAFLVYSEIMKEVKARYPKVEALTLTDFSLSSIQVPGRDLAGMMNMASLMSDTEVTLKPLRPSVAKYSNAPYAFRTAIRSEIRDYKGPHVVAFGDSFLAYLIPYLSESFSRGLYLAAPLTIDFSVIDKEKPNVVIVELVERYAGSLKIGWSNTSFQNQDRAQRWVFPPPSGN